MMDWNNNGLSIGSKKTWNEILYKGDFKGNNQVFVEGRTYTEAECKEG